MTQPPSGPPRSGPLRLGIVGAGALALRLLPHLLDEDVRDAVSLVALCDPVPGRAAGLADAHGIARHYERIEDLVGDPEIDAVTIASPIGLHAHHGRTALLAGKHVHFNKTMSTTVAEADELIALADAAGLRIVASPGEVLRPHLRRTRELIADGAIGRVCWAICGSGFGRQHEAESERLALVGEPIDPSWYFRRPGGGPLYDVTVYALHGITSVLGPAKRVTAMSAKVLAVREFAGREIESDIDDNTVAIVDFGEGRFAVVTGTAGGKLIDQFAAACYFGTEGEIRGLLLNGAPFDFEGRERTGGAAMGDWNAQMRALPHVVGRHSQLREPHVFEDIMQLVDWVREGKTSPVTAEHARHVIDIIESTYESAESGSVVELTTSFDW